MSTEKFWLIFWSIVATFIVTVTSVGVYSGYLDDNRNIEYSKSGLQPYITTVCTDVTTKTEWHEAGWNKPNETRSITILTPKGD